MKGINITDKNIDMKAKNFSYGTFLPLGTVLYSLMKRKTGGFMSILFPLFLFFPLIKLAEPSSSIKPFVADYYVSAVGLDSNPGTQGSPWQTVGKVNAAALNPGDHVHFRGGDSFYGALNMTRSGASGNPITFDSYGTGQAIITGLTTITGWVSVGTGRYESSVSSQVNMVVVNGIFQPIGRFPKMSASNQGYLLFQSHASNSVTSNGLAGSPNFTGGEVVVRDCHWILTRHPVTSQSTSTVTYTGGNYGPKFVDGNGFFFQNHPLACVNTLDWSSTSSKLTMYFGSGGPSQTVQAATVSNLLTVSGRSYINFSNLRFLGSNAHILSIPSSSFIRFDNCEFSFAGQDGVNANGSTANITLNGCTVTYVNNNGISGGTSQGWTITNCSFINIGSVAGMGGSGDGKYTGIYDVSSNSLIQYNTLTNIGYAAINFSSLNGQGNAAQVRNNFINGACLVKDDGAAVYTWGGQSPTTHTQRYITDNIILNAKGTTAGAGSTPSAFGIYMDDNVSDVTIDGNTVINSGSAGIYYHNARNITANNNNVFNSGREELSMMNDNTAASFRGINFSGNVFMNLSTGLSYVNWVCDLRSASNDISSWGTWNDNYYCRPLTGEKQAFFVRRPGVGDYSEGLAGWKILSGKDGNSKPTPIAVTDPTKIRIEYNETNAARITTLPGTFIDVRGMIYTGHITLAPYSSEILIQTVGGTPTYQNVSITATFTRNNCPVGQTGSTVNYTVSPGKYTSTVSQADANSKAQADINANGQGYANTNGSCSGGQPTTYTSAAKSGTYIRNNCQSGYLGSTIIYTVPAGKYSSSVSQADADGQAQGDVNANGQTYANQNGSCVQMSCSFWDKLFRRKGCHF